MLNFHIRRRILIYSRSMTASSPSDVRCRERGIASPSQCESCTAIPYLRICAPSPGHLCTQPWTPPGHHLKPRTTNPPPVLHICHSRTPSRWCTNCNEWQLTVPFTVPENSLHDTAEKVAQLEESMNERRRRICLAGMRFFWPLGISTFHGEMRRRR